VTAAKTTSERKTLVFHIGDHKTGSTAIQHAFARGAVTLEGRKLLYPAKLSHNYLRAPARALSAGTPQRKRETAKEIFAKLADQVRRSDADLVLISAEDLDTIPATRLRQIVDTWFSDTADDIRIVSYVRPHAPRLVSSFATNTKSGAFNEGTLEDFHHHLLAQERLVYHPRFTALRDAFGGDFILRPMIRDHLHDGDVIRDFIRHGLGVDSFHLAPVPAVNETLGLEDLMRLKLLQQHHQHLRQPLRRALGWEFGHLLNTLPRPASSSRLALHKSLAEEIRKTYLEDARALDRDFFDGAPLLEADLDRALRDAVDTAQSVDPADHLCDAEQRTLAAMATIVSEMLRQKEVDWPRVFRGRRLAGLQ